MDTQIHLSKKDTTIYSKLIGYFHHLNYTFKYKWKKWKVTRQKDFIKGTNINLNKYYNDGWGLNRKSLITVYDLIKNHPKKNLNVIEFGSGSSTGFFIDLHLNRVKSLNITSFDHDPKYAYKNEKNLSFLNLNITNLEKSSDDDFEKMFKEKTFLKEKMTSLSGEVSIFERNVFYNMSDIKLPTHFDFVLLDGPSGIGRSIAFLHLKNMLKSGSYIFIDDHNHYDFVERCQSIFNSKIIKQVSDKGFWFDDGNYTILQVL